MTPDEMRNNYNDTDWRVAAEICERLGLILAELRRQSMPKSATELTAMEQVEAMLPATRAWKARAIEAEAKRDMAVADRNEWANIADRDLRRAAKAEARVRELEATWPHSLTLVELTEERDRARDFARRWRELAYKPYPCTSLAVSERFALRDRLAAEEDAGK